MGLMLAGEGIVRERVQRIVYSPGLSDSGDLEAATKTIMATTEPGAADYTVAALGIAAPADSRLVVKQIGVRLIVTIDSFGGVPVGTTLNYRIKRGGTSIGTGALSTGGSIGQKVVVENVTVGTLTGNAQYDVNLWVDQGNCVVSQCQVQVGLGTDNTSWSAPVARCLTLTHSGFCSIQGLLQIQGSGTPNLRIGAADAAIDQAIYNVSGSNALIQVRELLTTGVDFFLVGTVANELVYITAVTIILRSEE